MSLQLTYRIETNDILLLNRNKLCRTNAMIEVTNKYEKSVGTIIILVVSQYRGITIHHGILINTHSPHLGGERIPGKNVISDVRYSIY